MLIETLEKLYSKGTEYFKCNKSGSGEYYTKMWTARSNKVKLRNLLPERVTLSQEIGEDLLNVLCEENVIQIVLVEDGFERGEYCVLLPIGVEMLEIMKEDLEIPDELGEDDIRSIVGMAKTRFLPKAQKALKERIQAPLLVTNALGARDAVFALFLILCGAVSKHTALILKEDENREIEFQEDLVQYLNDLARTIYKDSYMNRGKHFSVGDLSDYIRRSKNLVVQFGDVFKREEIFIYFDLLDDRGNLNTESMTVVMDKVISSLDNHSQGEDDDPADVIPELVQTYMIANPIKQTHRKALFVSNVEFEFYFKLQSVIQTLVSSN